MGCCISTATRDHDDGHNAPNSHRSPPPEEKETVKEVLSETPFHAPKVTESDSPSPHELQQKEISTALKEEEPASGHRDKPLQGDASELSEICSVAGGSFSTSTTNTSTVNNDDVTSREFRDVVNVRRRVVPVHSPATVKSTVTKPMNPPVIRSNVSGRGHGQRQNAAGARRSESGVGLRPVSSQRSRSPSTVRSPARRVGNGGDREVNERGETRKMKVALIDGGDLKRPSPADETLDNPMMSLECFIFL